RLLADMAGIEEHEVCVLGRFRRGIAVRRQRIGHALGIVNVHLAAIGLYEDLFGFSFAGTRRLFCRQCVHGPASIAFWRGITTDSGQVRPMAALPAARSEAWSARVPRPALLLPCGWTSRKRRSVRRSGP